MRGLALAVAVLALAVAFPATEATHYCRNNGNVFEVLGRAYVTVDQIAQEESLLQVKVYSESNGMTGLQRGGKAFTTKAADPCQDAPVPDLLLY